jgi:hypothetical protein
MTTSKPKRLEIVRRWFTDNGVNFEEFKNGHFRVFLPNGHDLLDFWSGTQTYVLAGSSQYHKGDYFMKVQQIIKEKYLEYYKVMSGEVANPNTKQAAANLTQLHVDLVEDEAMSEPDGTPPWD